MLADYWGRGYIFLPRNSKWRPISLCNVLYKLIAKAIANRLRSVIEKCIDPAQSAFVPRRLISDNVLLAYEILHTLKQKKMGKKGFMAVKLDISKAGLRQGDPLSPFLFLIYGEGLSSIMRLAMNRNILRGVKEGDKRTVSRILKVRSSNDPERYLGLPNMAFLQNSGGRKVKIKESIWAAKGILENGLCWRVGMGERIYVWGDLWISGAKIDRLQNEVSNENIKTVSDLIDPVSRTWNTDLIISTFNADVAKKILQIPLAETTYEDFQVWRGESSGEFSVRSAYKLLQEANSGPSNNYLQAETRDFYRKLWNLHLPSKIKITNWRISWNYIPTLSNLKTKKVVSVAICPRCQHPEEDSNHIFRYCPTAIDVWSNLNLDWVCHNDLNSIWEWLTWTFRQRSIEQCRLICCGLWLIWTCRNQLVYEKKNSIGRDTPNHVFSYISELNGVEQKKLTLTVDKSFEQTERNLWVTIFFYAAFDKGSSSSASGLAVRDEKGEILVSKTVIHSDKPTPFAAEAHTGLQAIQLAISMGEGFGPCSSRDGDSELKAAKLRDEEP
ncbi:hypothetical protein CXB51_035814 [Gossypium anomalum]|uniref:Reverse transcriptase domain-containing protein n=1 Tax=Gossypium anomalum TaxID=47600 RepID=A0A8J5XZ19_9ROSI|nr:hypothetical protein CXB51_035814 [Gossypium anomalum]